MKCCGILLPAMPALRNKVIYGYWLLSSDLCETSWIFLHGPVCPKTGPALSRNVVRFVLRRGPCCPGTWSVSSVPFCPWSVFVRVPKTLTYGQYLDKSAEVYTVIVQIGKYPVDLQNGYLQMHRALGQIIFIQITLYSEIITLKHYMFDEK